MENLGEMDREIFKQSSQIHLTDKFVVVMYRQASCCTEQTPVSKGVSGHKEVKIRVD